MIMKYKRKRDNSKVEVLEFSKENLDLAKGFTNNRISKVKINQSFVEASIGRNIYICTGNMIIKDSHEILCICSQDMLKEMYDKEESDEKKH